MDPSKTTPSAAVDAKIAHVRASAQPEGDHNRVVVMKARIQFLACNNKLRQGTKAFLLQAHNRRDGDQTIHVGFTCSKKVGNAVARNRAKRRLREIAHSILPNQGIAGWDYVLIGRKDATATRNFAQLKADLGYALNKVHN